MKIYGDKCWFSLFKEQNLKKLRNSGKSTKVSLRWSFHLQIKSIDYSPTRSKLQSNKHIEK